MNGAFYIGALGLDAQQRALDVVANNIANINTTGFKRQTVQFSNLVNPLAASGDGTPPQGDQSAAVTGVAIAATPHVWTEGSLTVTGQQYDLAISGAGFIEMLGPSGRTLLWRGGTLKVNEDGALAAADGTVLRADISMPQNTTALSISADGIVTAQINGSTQYKQIGQIPLAMVKDPDSLVDDGAGYFEASDQSQVSQVRAGDEGAGSLVQGALESGNVQLTDEMVTLMLLQRAYAADAQVVQAGDQLMTIANELRR
ncbi:MAG: flagellar hook-basal body protein [Alphaproteobacteria bacterium]|nr:flagellar hook-basal body protein [Alphaproteobacteria bacterium]MBV9695000.1 flagellar hook-basal body protein [Alphaproteobacteria bacterium]